MLCNIAAAPALPVARRNEVPTDGATKGSIFYKTALCRFYKAGKCTRGRHCSFAHGKLERNGRPDLGRTKMCPMLSSCADPKCTYAHARSELVKLDAEALRSEPVKKPVARQEEAFDFDALTAKATSMAAAAVSGGQCQDVRLGAPPFAWGAAIAAALPGKVATQGSMATTSAASSLGADDSDSTGDFPEEDAAARVPEVAQPVYLSFDGSGVLRASPKRPASLALTKDLRLLFQDDAGEMQNQASLVPAMGWRQPQQDLGKKQHQEDLSCSISSSIGSICL